MKRTLVVLLLFFCWAGLLPLYAQRAEEPVKSLEFSTNHEDDFRGYEVPVGLSLFFWSIPNHRSTVNGLRLNLGVSSFAQSNGFDVGLFSDSVEASGLQINVFGHDVLEDFRGVQIGLLNMVGQDMDGVQIGLVNIVGASACGVQIGLVNCADKLYGVQIGLANVATQQWSIPILNICW